MPTENKTAEPLKVERSTVTKLVTTGAPRLDAITVFLEDFGRRDCPNPTRAIRPPRARSRSTAGTSTGVAWARATSRTFVADCDRHYILNCLDRGSSPTVFSGNALYTLAKKCIVQRRRQQTRRHEWELGELSKDEARELWRDIEELRSIESADECWHQCRLLTELFGEEWHYPLDGKAVEENHKFTYLRRVVEAVQAALSQEQQQVAA